MSDKKPEERRRSPRVEVGFPVVYKLLDEAGKPKAEISGSAVNISGSGLRFHTEEELESGSVVSAEFEMPGSDDGVVTVGRVAWCRPSGDDGFDVGMEFWWLGWRDENAQQSLEKYVQSKAEKQDD